MVTNRIHKPPIDLWLRLLKRRPSLKEVSQLTIFCAISQDYITSRFLLKKQLLKIKYNESEPLNDHFLRFGRLIREVKEAGAQMKEEGVICHLMITMPESKDLVTTAMEAVSERLTMDIVRRNYLDVETKRSTSGVQFQRGRVFGQIQQAR